MAPLKLIKWKRISAKETPILMNEQMEGEIEEKERFEAELKKSGERFRIISDLMSDYAFCHTVTPDGKIVLEWITDSFTRRHGYTVEEINSIGLPNLIYPEDLPLVFNQAERALSGQSDVSEYRFINKDGEVRWIRSYVQPIWDNLEDRVTRIYGATQDFTERKRAEDERNQLLQNQKKWLESVLNLAPTPILLIEPGTAKVIFSNKAADYLAGGDFPKGIRAEEYQDVYHCTNAEGNRLSNEEMPGVRVARGERLEGFEMDWHTPLGKLSLLIFADTIPAMYGSPATSVLVFHNITQQKQIEKELRSANSMKDEFLATISHELRTPLQSILGWAKLIRTDELDKDTFNQAIESIERNAHVQTRLVEDLLDVSRIITGKIHIDNRLVDLTTVIDAALNTIRTAADAKKLTLQFFQESGIGPVFGDIARLQQVVWNLLSNAVKFTPIGGHIEVWLRKNNSQVEIKVRDTGQGIDPEFLPFVFDKFRQADSTTTRKHSGLGLGLAIVRYFVELHGGTVQGESAGKGQGSTFTVLLPLAK
jgi:PAS domain S-box-containing protein